MSNARSNELLEGSIDPPFCQGQARERKRAENDHTLTIQVREFRERDKTNLDRSLGYRDSERPMPPHPSRLRDVTAISIASHHRLSLRNTPCHAVPLAAASLRNETKEKVQLDCNWKNKPTTRYNSTQLNSVRFVIRYSI